MERDSLPQKNKKTKQKKKKTNKQQQQKTPKVLDRTFNFICILKSR